jgi:uncharacterized protein YndB with AHSA1/START domain
MTNTSQTTTRSSDCELDITRTFDAPARAVFDAWIDPLQAKRWMGPRGFTATHVGGNLEPGGRWRLCLEPSDGGMPLWQGGTYREVAPPTRLAFTFAWDGEHGLPGNPTLVTVTFTEQGERTRMTFQQRTFASALECDRHREGWNSTFDRLAEYLRQSRR